jgi:ribokinase
MRSAVVGHVEWIDFIQVEGVPHAGEIVTALGGWTEAAGGGAMAAGEFVRLGAETVFFTALGSDEYGSWAERDLRRRGLRLLAVTREAPQRRGFTFLDSGGERTITVLGEKLVPRAGDALDWNELESTDAVYFCGGDPGAVRLAREARALVATARELPTLAAAGVELDALVHSSRDPSETYEPGDLNPRPKLVATTEGAAGGRYVTADGVEGRWEAVPLPGPLRDSYGAGDCFAAGLAYALGQAKDVPQALAFAAASAAKALTRPGGHRGSR